MNILICANENFIRYVKTMLYSVAKNNKQFINVYLMYTEISNNLLIELEEYIKKKCNGKLYKYKINIEMFKGLPITNKDGTSFFGVEAYFRIFAQYFLPKNIDRILYLDIDIICNGNLLELYNSNFEENYYIACEDKGATNEDKKRVELKNNQTYINSGVLLLNLKQLRKLDFNKIIEFINKNKDILEYPDQDILNLMYNGKMKIANYKYNYITYIKNVEVNEKIINYHYAGTSKPWSKKNIGISVKNIIIYYKYIFFQKGPIITIYKFMDYIFRKIIHVIKREINEKSWNNNNN